MLSGEWAAAALGFRPRSMSVMAMLRKQLHSFRFADETWSLRNRVEVSVRAANVDHVINDDWRGKNGSHCQQLGIAGH
jgi:hypothetical protein